MNWISSLETVITMAKDVFIRGINEEDYEKLKSALMAVYGDYYGRLGEEASKAFSIYADILMGRYTLVENGTRTHKNSLTKTQKYINISKQKKRRLQAILDELQDYELILDKHLRELIIKKTGCHDRRTIKDYIQLLLSIRVLKASLDGKAVWYHIQTDTLRSVLYELSDFKKEVEVEV